MRHASIGTTLRFCALAVGIALFQSGWAQLMQATSAATASLTPTDLVSNIFLGEGVEVIDITFKGKPVSVGYFAHGEQAVGLSRGIVITTGLVETVHSASGPFGCDQVGSVFASTNVGGLLPTNDPYLSEVASGPLFDVTSYSIRFIPMADTLRFRYCFASEEYPEFACTDYNDIFGFFISGPNYPIPTNIALVPGTSLPVSINTVHPDNTTPLRFCPPQNAQYYISNVNSAKQPIYNGLTQVFTAEAAVIPCDTYEIHIVIADVGDPVYDSGVFLEAKSFSTPAVRVELSTPNSDGFIAEGCAPAVLSFRLPTPTTSDVVIYCRVWGTAALDVDLAPLSVPVVVPAGQQEAFLLVRALEDGMPEGIEWLAIEVEGNPCRRDTFFLYLRDNLLHAPALPNDTSFCREEGALSIGDPSPVISPPLLSFESNPLLQIHPVNMFVRSELNVTGVFPPTVHPGVIRSVCLDIDHDWIDDLDVYLVAPGGQMLELMTDCGGNGKNAFQLCFTPVAQRSIRTATATQAPFSGEWQPEGLWSDLEGSPTNGTWRLMVRDDQNGFVGVLRRWSITFEPPYAVQYRWSPAAAVSCVTCPTTQVMPQEATTYFVAVSDSYGCSVNDSIRVYPIAGLPAPQVKCGAHTASSLTFTWDSIPGAKEYWVNVEGKGWELANGSLSHTVVDLASTQLVSIEVQAVGSVPCPAQIGTARCANCSAPVVEVSVEAASCSDVWNGRVQLVPDGQNPPYYFALGGKFNHTGAFDSLAPGTYTAVVEDSSGCPQWLDIMVGSPPALSVQLSANAISCYQGNDGALHAEGGGGVPPYQYRWSNAQMEAHAVGLSSGTYTVTITDTNGCTNTASAVLSEPSELSLWVTPIAARCYGEASGVASVSVSGGTGPYQVRWSNGQVGSVATGLPAGLHQVTVVDAMGCEKTAEVQIGQPEPLMVNAVGTPPTCAHRADGTASVSASGGVGIYTYAWTTTPIQTTPTLTSLSAGTYTVTVSDQHGCSTTATVVLVSPPPLNLVWEAIHHVSCYGQHTGAASVALTGGTPPYVYAWSSGDDTPNIAGKPAGSYTLSVTDANGCSAVGQVRIEAPEALSLSVYRRDVACYGEPSGALSVSPIGGTPPYHILWDGPEVSGETQFSLEALLAGTYSAVLTDARGCSITQTLAIAQPSAPLSVVLLAKDTLCSNELTAPAEAVVSGGTAPYEYRWSNGSPSVPTLSALPSGLHAVTVVDAHGCLAFDSVRIVRQAPLHVRLALEEVNCLDGGTALVAEAAYGIEPAQLAQLSLIWNTTPPQLGQRATQLEPGRTYTVAATDKFGCTAVERLTIPSPSYPQASVVEVVPPRCHDSSDGRCAVWVSGGQPPYVYQWSHDAASDSSAVQDLPAGQYRLTVVDQLGCSDTIAITLPSPSALEVQLQQEEIRCFGESSGILHAFPNGGQPPYQFVWSNGRQGPRIEQLSAGSYSLTVTDSRGCTWVGQTVLVEPKLLSIDSVTKKDIACWGAHGGELSLFVSGGTPPYRYSADGLRWNGSARQIGLSAGTYWPKVSDRNGCKATFSAVSIEQPPAIEVRFPADLTLHFGETAQLTPVVEHAEPPLRFAWSGEDAEWLSCTDCPTPIVHAPSFSRWFALTVMDARRCVGVGRVHVEVLKRWQLHVPTAFSPNGDGNNDLLIVHGSAGARVVAFEVYDRWGERVFSATDFAVNDTAVGWDGYFRGQPLSPSAFIWVLQVEWPDGTSETRQGEVLLVR